MAINSSLQRYVYVYIWYIAMYASFLNSYNSTVYENYIFLNQAHAGLRPARDWVSWNCFCPQCLYACVHVCVCLPPRLLIASDMIWCDIELLWLVKQVVGVSLSFIWQLKSWQINMLVGMAFVNKMHHENYT